MRLVAKIIVGAGAVIAVTACTPRPNDTPVFRDSNGRIHGGESVTAMNASSSRAMVDSMNRLRRRYPQALNHPDAAVSAIVEMVRNFPIENSVITRLKKEAALRFLDRVTANFTREQDYTYRLYPNCRNPYTRLTVQEILALAWAGINDETIFRTEQQREDRKRALMESLATIQRAHNEQADDTIVWDPEIEDDRPSCMLGTFKRLIEHMERSHPDVRFDSTSPISINDAGAQNTENAEDTVGNQQISNDSD